MCVSTVYSELSPTRPLREQNPQANNSDVARGFLYPSCKYNYMYIKNVKCLKCFFKTFSTKILLILPAKVLCNVY